MRDATVFGGMLALVFSIGLIVVHATDVEEMKPGVIYIIRNISCAAGLAEVSPFDHPDRQILIRIPKECREECTTRMTSVSLSTWRKPIIPDKENNPECFWETGD